MSDHYGYYEIPSDEPTRLGPDPVEISRLFGPLLDELFVRALVATEQDASTKPEPGLSDDESHAMQLLNDEALLQKAKGDVTRLQELIELRLLELRLERDPDNEYLRRRLDEARKIQATYDESSD